MNNKKGLICMTFNGDYVTEKHAEFETTQDAWKHAGDMGSRWYFYPFIFVTSASGKSIVDSPHGLEFLTGKRVSTVAKYFKKVSELEESKNINCDDFSFLLQDNQ